MRVLITGASGFVGTHVASFCAAQGAEVVGLGRRPAGDLPDGAGYARADLTDPAATRRTLSSLGPDRVIHLAAASSVAESWSRPKETLATNLFSTLNLLEAVRHEVPEAIVVVAGSGEQYGPVPGERLPVREDQPLNPQNPYAVSKASADLLAGLYAQAHGLSIARTRAFNHVGPGQGPAYVVASFARQIALAEAAGRDRVEVVTGNPEVRRDFCDVRDVVRAYWLVLERFDPDSPVLNVCSGRGVSVAAVLAGLAEHTRLEVTRRTDPELVRPHEVMEIRGSHDELTRVSGWQPEIPLERTLADTLDWWRGRAELEGAPA